jgi:hypothetical protein
MGEFWKIDSLQQLAERMKFLEAHIRETYDFEVPLQITAKPYSPKRSNNANALFHVWCRELSTYFERANIALSEEQAKLLMKNMFLGREDHHIGATLIEGQVRHTSKLTSGEMKMFMDQVLAWAAEKGCALSLPEDNEYVKWSREHG